MSNFTDYKLEEEAPAPRDAFKQYRRRQIAELRPYVPGENMAGISISDQDAGTGSPKVGDMIARNPENYADQWLVSAAYFDKNFEPF